MRLSGGRLGLIWARLRAMGFDVDTILTHNLDSTGHEVFLENCQTGACIEFGDFIITDNNGNIITQ